MKVLNALFLVMIVDIKLHKLNWMEDVESEDLECGKVYEREH